MKKIKKKEFLWSMVAHLIFFTLIWFGMGITNTWDWFGKEALLLFSAGFVISGIILLTNKKLYNEDK